jgi:sRNA-binding protein
MNIAYPAQLDKYQAIAAAISLLAELYPKTFSIYQERRHPRKLGIHLDIQAALNGVNALGAYCANQAYLGRTRNGEPAGVVTAEEEAHAREMLAGIRAKKTATKAQAPPTKRLSLADLKAAALARKRTTDSAHIAREFNPEEITHAQNDAPAQCS